MNSPHLNAKLIQEEEQEATEQFIQHNLKDLSRPNAIRLKAGLQLLMSSDKFDNFETITSHAIQKELKDFKVLLQNPENFAPKTCQTEDGKSSLLAHIKQYTLNNLSLLDNRTAILPNAYTVAKTVKEGERLKSVVHTSALRNVVTAAHFIEAITQRFKSEGFAGRELKLRVEMATEALAKLHDAVQRSELDRVEKLLKVPGVDINLPNPEGLPLIHSVIRQDEITILKLLMTNPNINLNLVSNNGWTPLQFAARLGREECIRLLIQDPRLQINIANSDGWTALHWAAWHGFIESVDILLSHSKIEINLQDSSLCTPLHWAARNGQAEVISSLLAHPTIEANLQDSEFKTALHYAVSYDHLEATKTLLASDKVDVNAQDIDGLTPLHWAARNGQPHLVELLLAHPRIQKALLDHNEMIPQDWAKRGGFSELIPKLAPEGRSFSIIKRSWNSLMLRAQQIWNRH